MPKRAFYPRFKYDTVVLAERREDGTWDVEGGYDSPDACTDEFFQQRYSGEPGRKFVRRRNQEKIEEPNAFIDKGDFSLILVEDRETLARLRDENPDALIFDTEFGNVFDLSELPNMWCGFRKDGEEFFTEENEVYFFPYVALVEEK